MWHGVGLVSEVDTGRIPKSPSWLGALFKSTFEALLCVKVINCNIWCEVWLK